MVGFERDEEEIGGAWKEGERKKGKIGKGRAKGKRGGEREGEKKKGKHAGSEEKVWGQEKIVVEILIHNKLY